MGFTITFSCVRFPSATQSFCLRSNATFLAPKGGCQSWLWPSWCWVGIAVPPGLVSVWREHLHLFSKGTDNVLNHVSFFVNVRWEAFSPCCLGEKNLVFYSSKMVKNKQYVSDVLKSGSGPTLRIAKVALIVESGMHGVGVGRAHVSMQKEHRSLHITLKR